MNMLYRNLTNIQLNGTPFALYNCKTDSKIIKPYDKGARQMAEKIKNQRSRLGYGSSYRKGGKEDIGKKGEIDAVLGGQVWMVKPDKDAKIIFA